MMPPPNNHPEVYDGSAIDVASRSSRRPFVSSIRFASSVPTSAKNSTARFHGRIRVAASMDRDPP